MKSKDCGLLGLSCIIMLSILCACSGQAVGRDTQEYGYFRPEWESLTKVAMPEWLADAKYGIFMHWGPVTVPANNDEWYARRMYQEHSVVYAHHLKNYGPHKDYGYIDFIPQFKGEHFDADRWVKYLKDQGAKFIVPVAEHHDHFAMWDSDLTHWDAKEKGPKKDIIGLIGKAARRHDLVFGVSDHRARGRTFYTYKDEFDTVDPAHADFYTPQYAVNPTKELLKEWCDDWYARKIELIDKYQPSMLWFDYGWSEPMYEPYQRRLLSYYYNQGLKWGHDVVVTYKGDHLPKGSGLLDIERGKLEKAAKELWQTDTSVARNTWCYTDNMDMKPPKELIHDLIDIVSKNGVLLLNIGPRADGIIPDDQKALLQEIGDWLDMNGECIYKTRPWQIAEEGSIRFTRNGNKLYAILLEWPGEKVSIKSLAKSQLGGLDISNVEMIGDIEKLKWDFNDEALAVDLNSKDAHKYATVLKCTLKGTGFGYVDVQAKHVKQGNSVTASGKVMNFTDTEFATNVSLFADRNKLGKPTDVVVAPMSEQTVYFDSIEETTTYGATLRAMPHVESGVVRFSIGSNKPVSASQLMAFPAIDLLEGWLFMAGDDIEWSKPGVDVSDWKTPRVPGEWPIGRKIDAVGWYRNNVNIPKTWEKEKLEIDLGIVNDKCSVYLNGHKFGTHSNINLEFHTSATSARFTLPHDIIRFGSENVIAVRVYNKEGKAGMMGPPGAVYVVE